MKFPKVSVGVLNSRGGELFDFCKHSIERQIYLNEIDLVVFDNTNNEHTIGYGYNRIAEQAKHDWLLYVGDDDFIARTYILNLMAYLQTNLDRPDFPDKEKLVAVVSCLMLYNNETCIRTPLTIAPTGMIKRDFILEHKFDEELIRYVDTEFYDRAIKKNGMTSLVASTEYGYYYRQHGKNISGNKFAFKGKIMREIRELNNRLKICGQGEIDIKDYVFNGEA